MLGGELGQEAGLIDCEGEGLLDIHVLSRGHSLGGDDGVGVVGGGYDNSVSLVEQLVEHHAIVVILLRIRIFLEYMVGVFPVDVAKTDELLSLHGGKVSGSTSSDTNAKNLKLLGRYDFFLLFVLGGLSSHNDTGSYR